MIRKIKQEEVHLLYPFVYRIFSDMDFPLLQTVDGDQLNRIVLEAMRSPHYRYGYEHAWVCERNGQIAGVLFGYPGNLESFVDGPLEAALLEHGFPAITIKEGTESLPGEWYLDALVVAPIFRRQGIATQFLGIVDALAKEAGCQQVSVNCPTSFEVAYQLYENAGFKEKTKIVLGNRAFSHMTKNVN